MITLPWSVVRGDNHRLIPARGRRGLVASSDYRAAKQVARALIASLWHDRPLTGAVALHARVWMPDRRKRDAGNYRKMIGDAMTGICYDDDAQVWKETWERSGIDKENPRIEITVGPLTQTEKIAMQTAVFYGASDDLIEVEGVKGGDEFAVFTGEGIVHGKFNVGGRMRVYALYDGCWMFAVGQVDEDILIPDWAVRLTQQHRSVGRDPGGYSARLEIDVPDDVMVFREAL